MDLNKLNLNLNSSNRTNTLKPNLWQNRAPLLERFEKKPKGCVRPKGGRFFRRFCTKLKGLISIQSKFINFNLLRFYFNLIQWWRWHQPMQSRSIRAKCYGSFRHQTLEYVFTLYAMHQSLWLTKNKIHPEYTGGTRVLQKREVA